VTRHRAIALAATAIAVPFLIAAVLVGIAAASRHRTPRPSALSFNQENLPPVNIDRCPSGGDLLPQPATGSGLLPDVTLECIGAIGSHETVALRRLGGVPTVVNLWASWCQPCRTEMPTLQAAAAAAGGRVRIIGVNTKDAAEAARATLSVTGATFPSLADPAAKVRSGVGSNFMPTTLFVTADGHIAFRKLGPMTAAELRALIAEHLGVTL
jgi:thiol-disulfide isomerase/thioredoxin